MTRDTLAKMEIKLIRQGNGEYLIVRTGYKTKIVKAAFEGQALLAARKLYNF